MEISIKPEKKDSSFYFVFELKEDENEWKFSLLPEEILESHSFCVKVLEKTGRFIRFDNDDWLNFIEINLENFWNKKPIQLHKCQEF